MAHTERLRKIARIGGSAAVVLFVLFQLVPYGRAHSNPPVILEPKWAEPSTRELAVRACFDCHSNETKWPWYSHVAPVSWFVQRHVDEGRQVLNFSEWNRAYEEAHEAGEVVTEGEMPLTSYVLAHPPASLTIAEARALARGLDATVGSKRERRSDD